MTEHDLIAWRQSMLTRGGLKASSINRRLEAIRRLLRWAEASGSHRKPSSISPARSGIEAPARLAVPRRQATDSTIRARVRAYLGFAAFSEDAESRLLDSLADLALDGLGSAELVERAESLLLTARVVLPASAALERLVLSLN